MQTRDAVTITSRHKTPEGFLAVQGVFARTGLQQYRAGEIGLDGDPDRLVNVYRPPDQVFASSSMASFANKPVTDDHPAELVDSGNHSRLAKGMSGAEVTRDGIAMRGTMLITDKTLVDKIENDGTIELSNGYTADYDLKPGVTPEGRPFESSQLNIVGNHIAVVDRGRCGPLCSIADSAPPCTGECGKTGDKAMRKVKIEGRDYEIDDAVAGYVDALTADKDASMSLALDAQKRAGDNEGAGERAKAKGEDNENEEDNEEENDAEEEATDNENEEDAEEEDNEEEDEEEETSKDSAVSVKSLTRANDRLQAKLDSAKRELKKLRVVNDVAHQDKRAEVRADLINDARRLMPKIETKGKTNAQIRASVVRDKIGDEAVDKRTGDYIEATFDSLKRGGNESAVFASRNMSNAKPTTDATATDSAREKSEATRMDAWKNAPEAN